MKKLMMLCLIIPVLGAAEEVNSGSTLITPESRIHKCKDAKGRVTFSNQGCERKESAEELQVVPNVIDSSGLRAYGYRNPPQIEYAAPKSTEPFINPVDCENAKRMYEFAAGYRYARAGDVSEKAREVYRKCGYFP